MRSSPKAGVVLRGNGKHGHAWTYGVHGVRIELSGFGEVYLRDHRNVGTVENCRVFCGLSSPSVTESSTKRRSSPRLCGTDQVSHVLYEHKSAGLALPAPEADASLPVAKSPPTPPGYDFGF